MVKKKKLKATDNKAKDVETKPKSPPVPPKQRFFRVPQQVVMALAAYLLESTPNGMSVRRVVELRTALLQSRECQP